MKISEINFSILLIVLLLLGCEKQQVEGDTTVVPEADYSLNADQTHNRWSSTIEPLIKVESGSVIEVATEDASDQQLSPESTIEDLKNLDFDPIHPLTGPVYVEGAEPGDLIKVKLHKIELGDWGWTAIVPGFGFLADDFNEPYLKTFEFNKGSREVNFSDDISVPLNPFPGVMGVAPATDSMLSTIPPRANGGNMDDPHITEGTTVYFPVFVEGALFSIGDAHATQGLGEVCGTAIEAPMRIVYEIELIKNGRSIQEPQYETDDYYAVTGFGTTIDEAAKKATRYMIDYLVEEHNMNRNDAYALCSLAGDLKIAEVVDVPHMLVTMHMPKEVLGIK
ncbi:acetamidase/formamidase family protein [Fodinibius halophilus]|uniref:Acetamidase/formamidase family protein n=1 Tax=Fodinibius halophilus TaxID=1736908 RepID=A0A6M1T5V9_9BACT|nr:acetamidase/formamidase family protein [Fodinibius halophilus]NGP89449.1 acetamidase/formamidase family protein [Fodinibius halophilus]